MKKSDIKLTYISFRFIVKGQSMYVTFEPKGDTHVNDQNFTCQVDTGKFTYTSTYHGFANKTNAKKKLYNTLTSD